MTHLPSVSGAKKVFSPINLLKLSNRIQHVFKPNSVEGSRKNIAAHYDLNNDFFKLFLDRTMTYSCALFDDQSESLEQGQTDKYERLCKQIRLKAADHVLEIGCGWGGFAVHAASKYNCRITGITISKEQYEFAKERIGKAGLEDRVEIVFEDYRKVQGQFDKIVSIEMIEAVGHRYFKSYFGKINQLLKPNGILGLQAIIIPDSRYDEYRKSVDWLQKHIFPGGLLPSVAKINESINLTGTMNLYGFKEMGLNYAKTLRHWLNNFNDNVASVRKLGFDEIFIRKWEYYLCCCEASFLQRNINVVQMIYARPNNSDI
jgi:cyclopropane-fatty-acyl-phospholipid synthase